MKTTLNAINGYYYHDLTLRRDVFVRTSRERITDSFILNVINAAQNAANRFYNVSDEVIRYYKKNGGFQRVTLEETYFDSNSGLVSNTYWVNIHGDGFGGRGNDRGHATLEDCYNTQDPDGVIVVDVA